MPFLAASVPAAWIGGRIPVSETVFIGLLGGALLLSVSHLAFQKGAETATVEPVAQSRNHRLFASGIGGAIGLLSGIVGIGGGIFLAPVLYLVRWGRPRQIAAASTVRRQNIWRNSGLRA
ncbi:TSUP family transporter [Hankyongella ginsenosidimutans]|uniref:TSUP family transporter n=1 Tax=Hankyongella ginsenosidimutans TaxID=1763828 RepID=UPI001CA328C3|nr:TSUP family transporter [Hankyongella ginsenosidimutans]